MNTTRTVFAFLLVAALTGCGGTAPELESLDTGSSEGSGDSDTDGSQDNDNQTLDGEPWGSHTWPDDLTLEISAPGPCDSDTDVDQQEGDRLVTFTMSLTNGKDSPFEFGKTIIVNSAEFAGGPVEAFHDIRHPCTSEELGYTVIDPGDTHEFTMSFAVDADPGKLVLEVSPSVGQQRKEFSGTA